MDSSEHKALRALHSKYQTLRALRLEVRAEPPRAPLLALAREFPGALRELDQLPMELIDARLDAIERVLAGERPIEPWMRMQIGYHGFMRAVLRIRRLSRGRSVDFDDAARELAALPYEPALDEPPASRFGLVELRLIRRPPGGRLNPWVFREVAKDCGTTPEAVLKALFLR